jgi:hypothetical protein
MDWGLDASGPWCGPATGASDRKDTCVSVEEEWGVMSSLARFSTTLWGQFRLVNNKKNTASMCEIQPSASKSVSMTHRPHRQHQ